MKRNNQKIYEKKKKLQKKIIKKNIFFKYFVRSRCTYNNFTITTLTTAGFGTPDHMYSLGRYASRWHSSRPMASPMQGNALFVITKKKHLSYNHFKQVYFL